MIKRRSFLTAAAASAATLGTPGWIAKAFAQDDDGGRDRAQELRDLSEAYRRAQRNGRPLLVFVVPEDGGARWEHAHAFGELLNHGGDEAFVDLALAEVICSTMRTLRQLVPQAGSGEPWLVVVEPDQHPAQARALDVEVPEWPDQWTERGEPDFEHRMEQAIDQRIALLTTAIHDGLARDDEMLARRARAAEAQLDAALIRRVHAEVRRGRVSRELLNAAPAVVTHATERSPARRRILRELGAQARERLARNPVPGSQWATSWGCGITVEGRDDNVMMGCGMGHVPERSHRFLYWYTGQ